MGEREEEERERTTENRYVGQTREIDTRAVGFFYLLHV